MDTPLAQPVPSPQSPPPKNNLNIFIGILIFILGILAGLTLDITTLFSGLRIPFLTATPTPLASPKPTAEAVDPTANWKTYTDPNGNFEFKYPENLVYIEIDAIAPIFYSNQNEADTAKNCFIKQLGTYTNPCNDGLFKIYPARAFDTLKGSTGSTPTYTFTDLQNRNWFIVGPVYGLGGTETNAEGGTNHTYRIQIHIYNNFMKGQTDNDLQKQKEFIDQILSTFKFTEQTTVTPTTYTCPAKGWVDCMPGPTVKPECSTAAMTWYRANCPDFKGGAL